MNITASQVKELRERTNAGMMECKRALQEAGGDIEAAIEIMRKAGQAKAAKKAARIAAEGVIAIKVAVDGKTAFMVEVNSETDFVARHADFNTFVDKVVTFGLENKVSSLDALTPLAKIREELIAKMGENIQIRRVAFLTSERLIGSYCHGARIGVLVQLSVDNLALGKDLAMHIAASKPEVVAPENLSPEIIAKEKEIYLAQAEQSGKPREIAEKMVEGKIRKFMSEVSLVGQPFVKNPDITVAQLLKEHSANVLSFVRFEVGEGIEKEQKDFAEEVQTQIEGVPLK